jgi:hypothetical protein
MKLLVFFMRISNLLLVFQSNLCYIIWTLKHTLKIPNNYVIFQKLRMILIMKTNFINQKIYIKMFTTSILKCFFKKPNNLSCKNISPICKYLNFIFQIATNFKSNSNTCK